MRAVLKNIVAHTYKPLLVRYLSKTRIYKWDDITLEVPPEVFHPGFFSSTQLLLQYITSLRVSGKKILELGAGSGLISHIAARNGATVTATDINSIAIKYLHLNSERNQLQFGIIESDLFDQLPAQIFDIIAINPPYYKKYPLHPIDHAWYCGEKGEYFWNLFDQLGVYMDDHTETIMVCCDGCDLRMIEEAARAFGFGLRCMLIKPTLLEKNFIFKIEKIK